jgi:DNA-binding transcriptional LysR family regulator
VQLLERHTRGVELTEAGELLLERARAALSAAAVAGATGHDLQAGLAGTVRLGLASGARWARTSALLERFARERGRVELTLLEGCSGALWRDLRAIALSVHPVHREERVRLAPRIEGGDSNARRRMTEANLGLVFAIARRYRGRGARRMRVSFRRGRSGSFTRSSASTTVGG